MAKNKVLESMYESGIGNEVPPKMWCGEANPRPIVESYMYRLAYKKYTSVNRNWRYSFPIDPGVKVYTKKFKTLVDNPFYSIFSFVSSEISKKGQIHYIVTTFAVLWDEHHNTDVIRVAERLHDLHYLPFVHLMTEQNGHLDIITSKRADLASTYNWFANKFLNVMSTCGNGLCKSYNVQPISLDKKEFCQLKNPYIGPYYKIAPMHVLMKELVEKHQLGHQHFLVE